MGNKTFSKPRRPVWLTIYLADTDEIVAIGTYRQIAMQLETTVNNIQSIVSKTKSGKYHKYTIAVEDLDAKFYVVYGADNWRFYRNVPMELEAMPA